ncbi:cytidine deaminase [soil metagenome]
MVEHATSPPPGDIPWERRRTEARAMARRAYAPYSHVRVGAAALVDDGRIVSGCNVENASLGLTTCAENGLASALAASGGGRLVALAVVAGDGAYLAPCGRCRQVLFEFGGPDLQVDTGAGPTPLGALLPGAFGPDDVTTRRDPSGGTT